MARLNPKARTLTVKIVYYGPGLSGKTTNLVRLHTMYPQPQRGDLVRLDTETERTLFFDFFPARLGTLGGYQLKATFFTVPGQSFYNATRRLVVEGVDGLVFVADSAASREEANLYAMENLHENLAEIGRKIDDIPLVFQWNKRDLPRVVAQGTLERQLNPKGHPAVCAVATTGEGVWETQRLILAATLKNLKQKSRLVKQHVSSGTVG